MSKLTPRRRAKLPAKDFAFPGKRAYPLDTKRRAISALARGKRNLSPEKYLELARDVKRAYPTMHVSAIDGRK